MQGSMSFVNTASFLLSNFNDSGLFFLLHQLDLPIKPERRWKEQGLPATFNCGGYTRVAFSHLE